MGAVKRSLLNIVENLNEIDENLTIYAVEPWNEKSDAIIALEPDSGDLPAESMQNGMKYFLEISIARDFLKDFERNCDASQSMHEKCVRLIQYAQNDA